MKKLNSNKKTQNYFVLGASILTAFALLFLGIQSTYAQINSQLDPGDRNTDVTELQTYLSTNPSQYPSGLVTGYFGQLTKAGVERFQSDNNIVTSGTPLTTGYGRVGPKTRLAINAKIAGGTYTPTSDVYAPTIKSISVTSGSSSATINWEASEMAFGKVYYSTTPISISNVFDTTGTFSGEPIVSGTLANYNTGAHVNHTVSITGLSSNTRYYYLVVASDQLKNVSISLPASFQTQ